SRRPIRTGFTWCGASPRISACPGSRWAFCTPPGRRPAPPAERWLISPRHPPTPKRCCAICSPTPPGCGGSSPETCGGSRRGVQVSGRERGSRQDGYRVCPRAGGLHHLDRSARPPARIDLRRGTRPVGTDLRHREGQHPARGGIRISGAGVVPAVSRRRPSAGSPRPGPARRDDRARREIDMSAPFASWYRGAGVRSGARRRFRDETDMGKVFFPEQLVPYLAHEALAEATPEQRRALTIHHLYQFLLSTAHLETRVVNRAAELIANGRAGPELPVSARLDAFKIYCDEGYHSLYSLDLADQIARETGIALPPWDYGGFVDQLDDTVAPPLPHAPRGAPPLGPGGVGKPLTAGLQEDPDQPPGLTGGRAITRHHAQH